MVFDQSHQNQSHCLLIQILLLLLLLFHSLDRLADLVFYLGTEMAHRELKGVIKETGIFFVKLSVHLFQQSEVFTYFLCEVPKSEIKIYLILLLNQSFPYPYVFIVENQFLRPSEQLQIFLSQVAESKLVLN